jgi:two-component system sensor kinase FixL
MRDARESNLAAAGLPDPAWALLRVAVLTGLGYYAGVRIGMALTFAPVPVAILWPPNSLLLSALVLTPRRWWWAALAGAFPAHLLAELQGGVPIAMALGWFATNTAEAVIGALILVRFSDARGLRTLRSVIAFWLAAVVAPFVTSFLDAALVRAVGWSSSEFGVLWQVRFFSNVLAAVIIVPVILTWSAVEPPSLRQGARAQLLEVAALVFGLFAASVVVFDSGLPTNGSPPAMLYLPLPFLIWAALRFGPALTSAAYAVLAFLVVWGAANGRGPYQVDALRDDPLSIQLFLIGLALPLLILAAVIEERRESARKLEASEELYSSTFGQGPDPIALSRRSDGRIIEVNARWLELMWYLPATPPEAVAPFAESLDEASRRRLFALAADPRQGQQVEVRLRDRLGHSHSALVSIAAIEVAGEPCHSTVLRDITLQREAEQDALDQRRQLTHLTRVASLSDFSSTIAHELNQPLTAILANAQAASRFLQRDPPNVGEIRAILDEIVEADKRAGLLIHHLRLLMKKGEEEFLQTDVNHLVEDVLEFIRGEFLVFGDRVQLQQLLLNLVCNGCDAMQGHPGRRELTVSTSENPDGTLQVAVGDTGPGIAADRIERIFEPFYTTKESGLGMGLSICRRIAAAHGGVLGVQSRTGEGATFTLVLPPAQAGIRPAPGERYFDAGSRPTTTAP